MTQNIALIGFMGVGKSSVGRNLAKKLRRPFIDLDTIVEKTAGMNVREIFLQKGEPFFRALEKQMVTAILQKDRQVISTGGGVIADDANLMLLRDRALVVALTASVDVLLARAGSGSKRPLLEGANRKERVEELLMQRQSRYARAHVIIDTTELTVNQVVDKIMQIIESQSGEACKH